MASRSLEFSWALCLHYMWIIQEQHLEWCVTPKMCVRWMLAFSNLSALIICYIVYLHSKTRHFSTALWYRETTCTAAISHCTGVGYWLSLCLPKGWALVGTRSKLRPRVPSEAHWTTQVKLNSLSGSLTPSLKVSLVFCHIPDSSWPSLLPCSSLNLQFCSRAKALELLLIAFLTYSPFNTSEIFGCTSKYVCVCVCVCVCIHPESQLCPGLILHQLSSGLEQQLPNQSPYSN